MKKLKEGKDSGGERGPFANQRGLICEIVREKVSTTNESRKEEKKSHEKSSGGSEAVKERTEVKAARSAC